MDRGNRGKYCPLCERRIIPIREVNWLAFIFFGIFYLPVYFAKRKICPICHVKFEDD